MTTSGFENKKVLITGASGFIGHALATSLSRSNCSLVRSSRDIKKLFPLEGAATVIDSEADYSDSQVWESLTEGVDIIFYLGAQTSASAAKADPDRDFRENVLPLLNLLEHCRASASQSTIIFASTATVVGLTEQLPVADDVYENPITIYDIHKLCCEKYLSYYARKQHIKAVSLRLANVYGPGTASSSADRGILNMMMRRAIQRKSLSIFGEGRQQRDYTFISDVVAAFEAAALHIDSLNGRHFNIGSGRGHDFVEAFGMIAEEIQSQLGHETLIEHVAAPANLEPIETRSYIADTASFSTATGWYARIDLGRGIRQTVEQLAR